MKRIKYLIRKIFKCNYKELYKQARIIHKKRKKNTLFICIDMILCGILYGAGFSDYVEFEFDLLNKKQRKTYLTSELNNRIVRKYNNKKYFYIFNNKLEFNKIFKSFLGRNYISLTEKNFEDFKNFCLKYKKICVKPINLSCGQGIEIINTNTDLNVLYKRLIDEKKYLVEEYIIQHDELNKLNPKCVNTLRVISFLDDKNNSQILRAVMKFGTTGEIDNHVAGGMYTFLDENGVILYPACDDFGNVYSTHPLTNTKIVGFKVPFFKEALDLVKKASLIVPEMRYIGWDVAIKKEGPIIVEGNEYCGLFQNKASTNPTKIGDLPIFKKYIKF